MIRQVVLLIVALASTALAQQDYTHVIFSVGKVEAVNHHPACNPFSQAFDPLTLDGRGVRAPRIVFHLGYPLLNTGFDWTLKKLHVPGVIREPVIRFGLPLTPHLIQAYRGLRYGSVYRLNFWDWWYDFNGKQPLDVSKRELITRAVLDVPLSCFARP